MEQNNAYKIGFIPYALAAFLIGIVGGFSTVLGPSFVQDIGIAYNNTTWTALAQAMSTWCSSFCTPVYQSDYRADRRRDIQSECSNSLNSPTCDC